VLRSELLNTNGISAKKKITKWKGVITYSSHLLIQNKLKSPIFLPIADLEITYSETKLEKY